MKGESASLYEILKIRRKVSSLKYEMKQNMKSSYSFEEFVDKKVNEDIIIFKLSPSGKIICNPVKHISLHILR